MNFKDLAVLYKNELLKNVIPFWQKYSIDNEYGGFLTCLDCEGKIYDTDKFVWLQGRQIWVFSKLFNNVANNSDWLMLAEHGAGFLEKHGRDTKGNWYFSLNREGKPLVAPYNIFSDCFAAMAFGQLSKANGNDRYADLAVKTYKNILSRSGNPKGDFNKTISETRMLKGFSLPMIMCNLLMEIDHIVDKEIIEENLDYYVHEVMEVFYDSGKGLIRENVNADGSFSDTFEGRLINPGHGIEAMWFIMDIASRNKNHALIEKAAGIILDILNFSWDKEFGGVYYFLDIKGKPVQQLEWDQKLWWVHAETLIGLLKGYFYTKKPDFLRWFYKVHEYTWSHFPDPEYGEWFGYLNRAGELLIPLKGGKWKGCYHIPRALWHCYIVLEKLHMDNYSHVAENFE